MRKFLFSIFALLAVCTAGNAQISGLNIGYCNGEVSTTPHREFCSTEKDIWVSGAIWLPASDINVNKGNEIGAIRAGLAQKIGIDTMCVWLRDKLDGVNLAEGGIPKADIVKGWNEIKLNSPLPLDGTNTDGLYIGFSYHQSSVNQGVSVLLTPTPNALFLKHGDGEWTDRSDEGLLCVEGLVYGDNLPKLNLRLASVDAPEYYIIDKGKMTITGEVRNIAVQTITGFDVEARIDGIDEVYTSHIDGELAYQEGKTFEFEIAPAIQTTGPGKVTVTISKLNEGDDLNMEDNVASDVFDIVNHDYTRVMLLEEFTTEQCSNCPRVASYIHDMLEKDKYKDVVLAVCHHSAYYTDWLTVPCANKYLWYFNAGGSTYAPALMLDRWTPNGASTPVFNPSSLADLEASANYRLSRPAFVSLNIKTEADLEANKLNINVSGSRSKEDFCVNPPRITVYLVENNITAHSQAGASGTFVHQHVVRKVNSDWGEVIEWNGDDYSYDCTLDLRADYVFDNLQVIAMIYDYDANDATKNEVANAGTQYASDFSVADGISSVVGNDSAKGIVYDLQGRRIQSETLRPGLYIINGKKQVVK
ncbi:MAG: Omp28-related outer membrane protein [Prevotella sp.]|nr:Omp28-related outer membrane protein [Prevotella sp.]